MDGPVKNALFYLAIEVHRDLRTDTYIERKAWVYIS